MRALRVVGYDEEGVVILEDPDRRERFTVPADERLRAAARGDVQRLGQMSMELESQLRPAEIQARIRAGASVEQVAAAAGVPHQRIERFAYPVLLERSRIAEMARSAHPVREDGPDVRALGEVVSHTFGLRGQDYQQAEWDAWRGEDHKWVVTLSWRVGRSDITARWGYQPGAHGGTVTALDEHATDLIDGRLSRPPRRVGPVVDFSKPDAEQPDDYRTAEDYDTAEDYAAPAEAPRPAATTADRAGSGRQVARTTDRSTGRGTPAADRPDGADRPTARVTGIDRAASRATPTDAGKRATKTTTGPGAKSGHTQPATPAEDSEPAAKRSPGRKAKPVMPSWEDVLLGVKSQRS